MSKYSISLASLIISSAFLLNCGGGGGGGTTQVQQPTLETTDVGVTVSPQVSTPRSLSTQSLRKLQTQGVQFFIEVISSDKNGNVIERKSITAEPNKPATVKVKLSNKGGSIVVSATANGYNKASKTIKYDNPSELSSVTVNLTPVPVVTQIVNINKDITIQSNGKKYVRFAIVKDKNGITKLAVGNQQIKAMAKEGEKLIDVAIPLNKLQENTQVLKVEYKDFKPSNPDDYKNFPGEETVDGRRLISFGFDYLKITDQNGENPFKNQNSQGLTSQSLDDEYYRILRYVDCNQIREMRGLEIFKDEDESKPGIQFTFYAFDRSRGGWVEAGQGIFVKRDDIDYTNPEWDTIIQSGCDPDATSLDPDDGIASCSEYGIITDINQVCDGNDSDYVVISVTNPELEWKNLDYVVPGGIEKCCTITVKDTNGNPVTGSYLYVTPTGGIEWTEATTNADGTAEICTLVYDQNNATGTLYIYNPFVWDYNTQTIDFNNCPQEPIQLENPNKCTVRGKVVDKDNGNPMNNAYVVAHDSSYFVYNWAYTNENGEYSISVPCNTNIQIDINNNTNLATFSVNNSLETDEQNDDGTVVIMKDIQIQNNPPEGYIYPWDYTVKVNNEVTVTLCAWDWEGNYPIDFTVNDGTQDIVTGQINENEWCKNFTYTPTTEGERTLTAMLTDNTGKQSQTSTIITVTSQNSPPIAYLYGSVDYDGTNYIYSVYTYFYDEDGDTINWTISNTCSASTKDLTSGQADGWGEAQASFTASSNSCTFTLKVNDGVETTTRTLTLSYQNIAPSVYLWADPGTVVKEGTTEVTVYSYIYDDDSEWTCQWYVNGSPVNDVTDCSSYTLELSNAQPGNTFEVKLEVTDPAGNTGTGSIKIFYATTGSVNIIIQNK